MEYQCEPADIDEKAIRHADPKVSRLGACAVDSLPVQSRWRRMGSRCRSDAVTPDAGRIAASRNIRRRGAGGGDEDGRVDARALSMRRG